MHRILEIAHDCKGGRGAPDRQPIDDQEYAPRETAERFGLGRAPALREKPRSPVKDCSDRAGKEDEPERDPEYVAVRRDQCFFDGQARDRLLVEVVAARAAPRGETPAGPRQIVVL